MQKLMVAIFVIFVIGCAEKPDDPVLTSTDAAPDQYKVEFENDYVRVISVHYGPGESSAMHSHEPFVGVTLTGAQSVFTNLDGTSETRPESFPGDLIDGDLSPHAVRSISTGDQHSIFVEIKQPYPAVTAVVPNIVEAAPSIAKVELEKPGIRVVRIKNLANNETPLHSHRAGVSVALTEMQVAITSPDGEVSQATRPAGDVAWEEERAHSGKNLSDQPTEIILFELL